MSRWCYLVSRRAARALTWPFVDLHVWSAVGSEPLAGGAVMVANHISHFDPFFLALLFNRTIDWMTTAEFYSNPLIGAWLRAVDTFPVDRARPDRRALRAGVERLQAGRLIGVFPEGGIRAGASSILEGAAPKSGASALARLADVPIIPCVILGTDRLYAKRSWRPGLRRTPVWVARGAPFSVAEMTSEEANARLTAAVREVCAQTVAHFSLSADDWPATPQHRKGRDAEVPA